MTQPLPLDGVKVVELTLAIAGPAAGATLADYGADVIKIEPTVGDSQRHLISGMKKQKEGAPPPDPYKYSPHFCQVNRGKRSVILDLKSPKGMEALHALLAKADVFVSNYRYGSLVKLGLGAEDLLAKHPRLVICPMTGWGMEGPDKDAAVYDVGGFWARSGAAHVHQQSEDTPPPVLAPGFGDVLTGMAAAGGICAALVQVAKTGTGRVLTTNLLRTGTYANSWSFSSYFAYGREIKWGSRTAGGNPLLMCYQAGDSKSFWLLGAESARHWPGLCKAMNHEEWMKDERFKDGPSRTKNQAELVRLFDATFARQPLEYWAAAFDRQDVWWQKVQQTKDVVQDPQALAAGCFVQVPLGPGDVAAGRTELTQVAAPVDFLGSTNSPRRPVPAQGEHTEEVSNEYGLGLEAYKSKL